MVISKSYLIFLMAIILGVVFDIFFEFSFINNTLYKYLGLLLMAFGTILIYWAQSSSSKAKKEFIKNNRQDFNFGYGPYRFFRHPSYLGVAILSLGFGLVIGSVFSLIFSVLAYFIIIIIFASHEEKILEYKHKEKYINYKKKVK